ncbi:MAG: chemotaxis protein CheW [Acidobacteriota bacterium]
MASDPPRKDSGLESKRREILEIVRARKQAEKVIELEEGTEQIVFVTLAGALYGLEGKYVKEILTVPDITFVPSVPPHVLGVINLRGDVESVFDVRQVLGLADSVTGKSSRIVLAAVGDVRSGILVDSVEEVASVPRSRIAPPLHTMEKIKAEFLVGETTLGDRNAVILSIEQIWKKVLAPESPERR